MFTDWNIAALWKHRNNTDVAIQVLQKEQLDSGDWKLRVMWYNVGRSHDPYCMGITQDIVISNRQLPDWEVVK